MSARRAAVALAAVAVWLLAWTLLHHGPWNVPQIVDTPVYESYGDAMRAGAVPYRDFALEYPPGALPAFLAPEVTARPGDAASYDRAFERWMAACGVVLVLACAAALAALRVRPAEEAAALGLVSVSPLLLGNLVLSRFDLWPAALTAAALAALLWELDLAAAALLALAAAAKLYPAVLVPLGLAWVWRRRGLPAARRWTLVLLAVLAAAFLPFAAFSPGGVAHSFSEQLGRPLQIESLGAAALVWAHHVFGLALTVRTDRSQNLAGALPDAIGALTTALQALGLVAVWALFARGPATRARLALAAAAALATFVALGKVFSPQFMVWLIPAVPLVRGRRGLAASGLLAAALVLTQVWFPSRYWQYAGELRPGVSAAVLVRDVAVLALAALLGAALARQTARPT